MTISFLIKRSFHSFDRGLYLISYVSKSMPNTIEIGIMGQVSKNVSFAL